MKKINYIFFLLVLNVVHAFSQSTTDSILQLISTAKQDTLKAQLYLKLVELADDDNTAMRYNNEAHNICKKHLNAANKKESNTFLTIQSEVLNNKGYVYETQGNLDSAIYYFNAALTVNEKLHSEAGKALLLNNIAGVYESRGNIETALKYYDNALKINEKLNNKEGIAQVLNNLGYMYSNQNDFDKALEFYERSYKLKKEIGNKKSYSVALANIGYIYDMKKDKYKAMSYYMMALKEATDQNDKERMALVYNNMGCIYRDKNEFNEALKCFRNSLSLSSVINEKDGITHYLHSIGSIHLKMNNVDSALYYGKKSYSEAISLGAPQKIIFAAELLQTCYKQKKDYTNAFLFLELYLKMKDSISSEDTKKLIYKQQIKYDYDKKAVADSVKASEEKKVVEAKLEKEKTQRYTLYGGLFLTALFGGFMYNRFRITKRQKQTIEEQKVMVEKQKHLVEEKQKEILDSIRYAKRIQQSLLPNENYISKVLSNNKK